MTTPRIKDPIGTEQERRVRRPSGVKAVQDATILGHIRRLADESLRLWLQHGHDAEDKERLTRVQVELHQCWDLLRQRRARRQYAT
jgi:Protein of unknown function (DUF2630)